MTIQFCPVIVKDKPFCYWDVDIKEKNNKFIDGIDPNYFDNLANLLINQLEGENKHTAALTIRASYFHGLETLFSILFATIQSPYCVYGWLHQYQTGQLRSLTNSINNNNEIRSKINLERFSWEELSGVIHQLELKDKEKEKKIKASFGFLWDRLAHEYMSDELRIEYNHIKHGFRVSPGGLHVAVGEEKEAGVQANPKDMVSLGGGDFGSTIFIPLDFQSDEADLRKLHFKVDEKRKTWEPQLLALRLKLISQSVNNILSYLKGRNGFDASEIRYVWPSDMSIFDKAWEIKGGVFSFRLNSQITEGHIKFFDSTQILNQYDRGDLDAESE